MKKSRYRTVPVQAVKAPTLIAQLGQGRCIVAIDIAKEAMVAGIANAAGVCQQLVRFSHPTQTLLFATLLVALRESGLTVEVAMEPTGVYGDSLRHVLKQRDFAVFRVDPARAHAMSQVLDGVPSLHDPKACTLIADLHARGLSTKWQEKSAFELETRALMDERDLSARPFERCVGQLEATIARYFPELGAHIAHSASWHLNLLSVFPSPAHIVADPQGVREHLRKSSHGTLSAAKIDAVIADARRSLGTPMSPGEAALVVRLATFMLELRARMKEVDRRIRERLATQTDLKHAVTAFGATTMGAILADLGNPAAYGSAAAFEKAMGLNLKEKSSGKTSENAPLHITKRGPARSRQYLYMAALRAIIHDDTVRAWYQHRRAFAAGYKIKAVVAVMRKLARALVHVARGNPFDASKLFDVRRLGLTPAEPISPSQLPTHAEGEHELGHQLVLCPTPTSLATR